MANKMLIDASHPEETRVVALRGNRVEEFDFESASKKPLRGNIYLAKVTRVEPSLQAAFIEYGGNRHGFLAFSEIHPDYYQIPVADRQALLEEEARAHREEDEEPREGNGNGRHGSGNGNGRRSRRHRSGRNQQPSEKRAELGDEVLSEPIASGESEAEAAPDEMAGDESPPLNQEYADPAVTEADARGDEPILPFPDLAAEDTGKPEAAETTFDEPAEEEPTFASSSTEAETMRSFPMDEASPPPDESESDTALAVEPDDGFDEPSAQDGGTGTDEEAPVEQLGGDAMEDATYRAPRLRRHYKIQEVIKRRQILLVQVVKEERGNKGAALTTYLSLAGRYSVLMPNTARGGGISRKITDADDRRRLKAIANVLDVPEGMGIILRTAGAARGETEVKRDFEYLLRMWETVRELTLSSSAPKLVYEEGSLIKRAIRDLYTKDVEEVWVSGEAGYREAKDYVRLLMPGHTKNVHLYADSQPIFAKSGAEAQLDAMFSNHVTLKSGGYLVINQTEALVAIDVNSGRSTREHNIEDTALRTNLEAADEVARQLRLRDLAGLIVVCPHCAGAGTVRSTSSIALHVLRVLEDTLIRSASHNLVVRTRSEVALYILNQKRANLTDLEIRFGVTIVVLADETLTGTVYHAMDRGELATPPVVLGRAPMPIESADDEEDEDLEGDPETAEDIAVTESSDSEDGRLKDETEEQSDRRRRRRRRRRGRDRDTREPGSFAKESGSSDEAEAVASSAPFEGPDDLSENEGANQPELSGEPIEAVGESAEIEAGSSEVQPDLVEPRRRTRRTRRPSARGAAEGEVAEVEADSRSDEEAVAAPRRSRRSRTRVAEDDAPSLLGFAAPSADRDVGADTAQEHPPEAAPADQLAVAQSSGLELTAPTTSPSEPDAAPPVEPQSEPAPPTAADEPPRPKRSGWWQRAKATLGG